MASIPNLFSWENPAGAKQGITLLTIMWTMQYLWLSQLILHFPGFRRKKVVMVQRSQSKLCLKTKRERGLLETKRVKLRSVKGNVHVKEIILLS